MTSPWERPGYSDLAEATIDWPTLGVRFANGDAIQLEAETVGAKIGDLVSIDADEPTGLTLSEAGGLASRRVSWELLRILTDPAFRGHRQALEHEESKRIGLRLRALREDLGIKQKQLSAVVGMSPPQLAKIERGETDLRMSTVTSLLTGLGSTIADISGQDAPTLSGAQLVKRVGTVGVGKDVAERIVGSVGRRRAAAGLAAAFGLRADELFSGSQLTLTPVDLGVQFKSQGTTNPYLDPMLVAAKQISEIVVRNVDLPGRRPLLAPESLIGLIDVEHAGAALSYLVEWCWRVGIPVIPLYGRGGFAAAIWEVDGGPVILLKDSRTHAAYWLFDLAHELGHLAMGHLDQEGVVDVDGPSMGSSHDQQEAEATKFALDLLIPGVAGLLAEIRTASERDGPRLFKGAVASVAKRAGVDPSLLGVVAAFELDDVARPGDRWGSAHNLATDRGGRVEVAKSLLSRLRFPDQNSLDAAWIRALTAGG